jgi:hypothetical protein
MKTTKNDITGDKLASKKTNKNFRDNYDLIKWDSEKDEKREPKNSINIRQRSVQTID